MKVIDAIEGRLVHDWRNVMRWHSAQAISAGAALSAIAFALSLSSAGMQFMGAFGVRGALGLCLLIFVCAFVGRVWKQVPKDPPADDTDGAGA